MSHSEPRGIDPLGETCEYRTGDDDLDWLAHRVAMIRLDFEVRDSPELAERLAEMADRLSRGAGRRGGRD